MRRPRPTLTSAELAILGLLAERPRHGYEIEHVITERGMREWTELGFSSIYYILGRLETAGLARASRAPSRGRGPARNIHAATPAGIAAWRSATITAIATPTAQDRPYLTGLAGLAGLTPDETIRALEQRLAALAERRDQLGARRAAQEPLPWFAGALFDHADAMLAAEIASAAALRAAVPTDSPASGPEESPAHEVAPMPSATRRRTRRPFVPELTTLPARTMAVVRTTGDPADAGARALPALYGAVYGLKFARKTEGLEFAIEPPCARWFAGPDWRSIPRDRWQAAWAIPVPDDTSGLAQRDPATPIVIERWEYGEVAQVLHVGTYAEEEPTIDALHAFIAEQGWEIAGPHEEVYLSRPGVASPKTIIRYQVRRAPSP